MPLSTQIAWQTSGFDSRQLHRRRRSHFLTCRHINTPTTTTLADRVGQDAETRPAASSSSFSAGSIASASSSMSLAISGVVTKPKSTTPL